MPAYVYGVVAGGSPPPDFEGLAGTPVRVVADEGAGALVSDVGEGSVQLGRAEVAAHGRVLAQAFEHGTVLPMRFGVVMQDDDDVRERLLAAHREQLNQQLGQLEGKAEITIRASYDEAALMREVLAGDPEIAQMSDSLRGKPQDATYYERIALGERVAKAIERLRERDAADIVDVLSQVASAYEILPSAHERIALNASFLVERARLGEFDEVLDAFAEGNGGRLRFKYTGPLPPHSFVQLAEVG